MSPTARPASCSTPTAAPAPRPARPSPRVRPSAPCPRRSARATNSTTGISSPAIPAANRTDTRSMRIRSRPPFATRSFSPTGRRIPAPAPTATAGPRPRPSRPPARTTATPSKPATSAMPHASPRSSPPWATTMRWYPLSPPPTSRTGRSATSALAAAIPIPRSFPVNSVSSLICRKTPGTTPTCVKCFLTP